MIKRYDPKLWESAIGEPFTKMVETPNGQYVSHHDHMTEITRLQEQITELKAERDGHYYGDA